MFSRIVCLAALAVPTLAACGAPDPAEPASPPAASSAPSADRAAIDQAAFTPEEPLPEGQAPGFSPALARAQVLLDRARFSPGVIDGLGGDNTRQAIQAYEKAQGLPEDGELDAEVFAALTRDAAPALTEYTITAADVAGPFIPVVPEDMAAMAELDTVAYTSPKEALAERFHMDEDFLDQLNPGATYKAGDRIVVAAVSPQELPRAVAKIEVSKGERSVRVFDEAGELLAFYPATIGSAERPSLSGAMTVRAVAPEPTYTYDPERLTFGDADRVLTIPAGPNNPVGSVWIDLSKDTYGIHGTPDPSLVGKTFSNGCVRLTNWNAEQLAASVDPGVEVVFV